MILRTTAALALAFASVACAPLAARLTTEPAPVGRFQGSFGVDGLYFRDLEMDTRAPSLMLDAGARYGLTEDLDVGLRLYTLGAEVGAKWRFVRAPVPMALSPAVSIAGTRDTGATTRALFLFAELPLVVGFELSPDAVLNVGPKLLYAMSRPVGGGTGHGLLAGGFVSVDLRPSGGWHLIPAASLYGTAAGEVPTKGLAGSLGVGVARDF